MLNHHKWCPFCLTDDHHKGTSALWITSTRVLDHLQSHLQCEILAWLQDHLSFPFWKLLSPKLAINVLLPSRKRRSGSDQEIEINHRKHETEASDGVCEINWNIG